MDTCTKDILFYKHLRDQRQPLLEGFDVELLILRDISKSRERFALLLEDLP
jgi:hypothetical protein